MDALFAFGPSSIMVLLGVLLLFAAIIGGGLEIKELKIPKIDRAPRILTALLGTGLLMCGGAVGLLAFAKSMQQPVAGNSGSDVTVGAAPTMDMSMYVTRSAPTTIVVINAASVVIHDTLAEKELWETVDVTIDGVKRGTIFLDANRPTDSITITLTPGRYDYSLAATSGYKSDPKTYSGKGVGIIEIADGNEFVVGFSWNGDAMVLRLDPRP